MDKSDACVDGAYPAIFSQRAGDEARYSHNCLARIKKRPHLIFPPPLNSTAFTHCMVLYTSY